MAYCTIDDVKLEAGTALGTITDSEVTSLIIRADEEIVSTITARGYTAPTADNNLKTASIKITFAKIKRRQSEELSRPSSLTLTGDLAFSVNPEVEIKALMSEAYAAIDNYVLTANSANTYIAITPNPDGPYLDLR